MRVAIIGSRKRDKKDDIKAVYDLIKSLNDDDVVVSGGCWGVDSWAVAAAMSAGNEVMVHRPNIDETMKYGQMVEEYYRRNRKIVDDSDIVYAFVSKDGKKKGGTWYTINYAIKCGKEVKIL